MAKTEDVAVRRRDDSFQKRVRRVRQFVRLLGENHARWSQTVNDVRHKFSNNFARIALAHTLMPPEFWGWRVAKNTRSPMNSPKFGSASDSHVQQWFVTWKFSTDTFYGTSCQPRCSSMANTWKLDTEKCELRRNTSGNQKFCCNKMENFSTLRDFVHTDWLLRPDESNERPHGSTTFTCTRISQVIFLDLFFYLTRILRLCFVEQPKITTLLPQHHSSQSLDNPVSAEIFLK